jgi:hypothetical protein
VVDDDDGDLLGSGDGDGGALAAEECGEDEPALRALPRLPLREREKKDRTLPMEVERERKGNGLMWLVIIDWLCLLKIRWRHWWWWMRREGGAREERGIYRRAA